MVRTVRQQACHSLLREIMSTNDTFGDTDELYDEGSASSVVLGIAAGFLIGLLIRTVSALVPYRWRKFSLPFTASMLIAGLLCGLIVVYANPSDGMTAGLEQLEGINPTVLFAVFMPALITPSGLSLEYHTVNHICTDTHSQVTWRIDFHNTISPRDDAFRRHRSDSSPS